MNDKHLSKQAISFFALLAVVVIAAFMRSGWIGGLHALSFAINIVGYIILLVVKLLGATLPSLRETIVQNVITTVLIWLVCTVFWFGKKEERTVSKIIAGIVSAFFTALTWCNLI